MFNISGDWWKVLSAGLEMQSTRQRSKADYRAGKFRAERLEENAEAARAAGIREAAGHRKTGRVAMSDAVAAFAGQGSVTDPVLLAKIKKQADYNSLATLFETSSRVQDLKEQAMHARYSAGRTHAANLFEAGTTMLTSTLPVVHSGVETFGEWLKSNSNTKLSAQEIRGV